MSNGSVAIPDENGLMVQTTSRGEEFLEHYGVKGMRWGVRNAQGGSNTSGVGETKREGLQRYFDPQGHSLKTDIAKNLGFGLIPIVGSAIAFPSSVRLIRGAARGGKAKAVDRQEKRFAKKAMSPKNFVKIHNGAIEKANRDLVGINEKYPKPNQNAATQKKYDAEVLKSMQDAYKASANSLSNKAQTMHLDVEFKNDGADFTIHARQGAPTPMPERVKHAAEDVVDEEITVEITGKIQRDADGHIVGFILDGFEPASMTQSAMGADFVQHYGVKGMHWGVRRGGGAVTTQTHIDTGLLRRRTKVVAKGGAAHPAHPDAIKAAVQKQKLKKSGTDALSTQELRDLANRLQVENQVQVLASAKGKNFVTQELQSKEVKRAYRTGAKAAAPHVVKRVKKGAATAATIAALV